ncbi:hypothetical protein FQN54_002476 [Arachnomyces sp. PD_36]|nr:hypothetical protein FQN54_002476 [Arachnomyces sp. PD_36]
MLGQAKSSVLVAVLIAIGSVAADPQVAEVQEPEITPPPVLRVERENNAKRQNEYSDLIGYYSWDDYWYSQTCDVGQTYATYSTIGGCCEEGEQYCTYATGCNGNQVEYINGGTAQCDGGKLCDTLTVLNSREPDPASIQSVIRCFSADYFNVNPRTYYRQTFPLTTSTSPSTSSSSGTTVTATATGSTETKTQIITARPSDDSAVGIRGELIGTGRLWFSLVPVAITFLGAVLL